MGVSFVEGYLFLIVFLFFSSENQRKTVRPLFETTCYSLPYSVPAPPTGPQLVLWMVTKSISHHLRFTGMMRFPRKYRQMFWLQPWFHFVDEILFGTTQEFLGPVYTNKQSFQPWCQSGANGVRPWTVAKARNICGLGNLEPHIRATEMWKCGASGVKTASRP